MKSARLLLVTLLITACLWTVMSWPLPRHIGSGIPSSADNTEKNNWREMIVGDHLQFFYHMWLAKDTFAGKTPFFHNIYEFNTGNDENRYEVMFYYLPFSLFFSIFSLVGSSAFAWNATGFVAIWLTFLAAWGLFRRYTARPVDALLAAALAVMFPYRWMTLLGGSPTGLAMMWVPCAFLGLDLMVRDRSPWGAAFAGASIYFASWCDIHVPFFTCLAAPFFCLFSYWFGNRRLLPARDEWRRLILAALPLIPFFALMWLQSVLVKTGLRDTTIVKAGRTMQEILLGSPHAIGLVNTGATGLDAQIYIGWILPIFAGVCLVAALARFLKPSTRETGSFVLFLLLCLSTAGLVLLALGPNMPNGERFWSRLVRLIPPYGMIRQPAKVLCLAPVVFGLLIAIGLPNLMAWIQAPRNRGAVSLLLFMSLLWDYSGRINPTVCVLGKPSGAYKAVSADATGRGEIPRLLAIPLWPGDSHWTSLNQYYTTFDRIRMVNGYRPTVRQRYFREVFLPLESVNSGRLTDSQIALLESWGVHHIVLHEDAFPEKVSSFSVGSTLQRLLAHPRLRLLAQDGPVWAFRIEDEPSPHAPPLLQSVRFPTRIWDAEFGVSTNAANLKAEDASNGLYVSLPGGSRLLTRSFEADGEALLALLTRMRGTGACQVRFVSGGQATPPGFVTLDSDTWTWNRIALPAFPGTTNLQVEYTGVDGTIDVDAFMIAGTEWDPGNPPRLLVLSALSFFHAGYTDMQQGEVVLRPPTEPADAILYGPKLPFPAGTYEVEVDFRSDAPAGTQLGTLQSRYQYTQMPLTAVVAGQPCKATIEHRQNQRLALDLCYTRNGELRIRSVTFIRATTGMDRVRDPGEESGGTSPRRHGGTERK